MTLLLLLICLALLVLLFIKFIRQRKFLRALRPYYELMYNYDTNHKLTFAIISPVTAVRPRSEYSGFTCKVYFDDYEQAEAERERIIEQNQTAAPSLRKPVFPNTEK